MGPIRALIPCPAILKTGDIVSPVFQVYVCVSPLIRKLGKVQSKVGLSCEGNGILIFSSRGDMAKARAMPNDHGMLSEIYEEGSIR